MATGAVIGGAVAAVSYTVNYYAKGYNKARYKTTSSDISSNSPTYDAGISHETMQNDVNAMRNDNFTKSEISEFEFGKDTVGWAAAKGAANTALGQITFGALSGGFGSELKGGNFWQGVVIGGMVAGLNHEIHKIDSSNMDYNISEDYPQQTGDPIPTPDASKLDPKYGVGNKDWQNVSGRQTITKKKEILQWDSKKGEIELYNKSRQISKAVKSRIPTGGWKINTGNILKTGSKILNGLEKINKSMIIFDFFPVWMIPYQTGTIKYQPEML